MYLLKNVLEDVKYQCLLPSNLLVFVFLPSQFGHTAELERTLGRPLLTLSHVRSLRDLHPFFHTVAFTAEMGEALLSPEGGSSGRSTKRGGGSGGGGGIHSVPKSVSTPELRQLESAEGVIASYRLARIKTAQAEIEQIIEMDFLDPLPRK